MAPILKAVFLIPDSEQDHSREPYIFYAVSLFTHPLKVTSPHCFKCFLVFSLSHSCCCNWIHLSEDKLRAHYPATQADITELSLGHVPIPETAQPAQEMAGA